MLIPASEFDIQRHIEKLRMREQITKAANVRNSRDAIRLAYKLNHDDIMKEHCSPYFYEWKFTHIEMDCWYSIRCQGLPFYPQYPVGPYFLDFADVRLKIAVEADGRQWHSEEKDKPRDEYLSSKGWIVFRLPGSDCRKCYKSRWQLVDEGDYHQDTIDEWHHNWLMNTSEGFFYALEKAVYRKEEVLGENHCRILESRLPSWATSEQRNRLDELTILAGEPDGRM